MGPLHLHHQASGAGAGPDADPGAGPGEPGALGPGLGEAAAGVPAAPGAGPPPDIPFSDDGSSPARPFDTTVISLPNDGGFALRFPSMHCWGPPHLRTH